ANYFGECLEWLGFAIASWSLPALAFSWFTFANIGPRAYHHHLFYKEFKFNFLFLSVDFIIKNLSTALTLFRK
ncbi:MAG: hypothetical protein ACKPKO_66025, partial [Candidatus Fonsibacter sp.]